MHRRRRISNAGIGDHIYLAPKNNNQGASPMKLLRQMTRTLCAVLALSVASLSLTTTAQAAMVGTGTVIANEQVAVDRVQLAAALDRSDVQQQLAALGVDPQQAKERVAAMTDDEVQALNGRLNELPAGGDILGVALVVFIVLLVTDILGYTHLFPFVNHPR
jgi:hypothetical protein